MIGSTRRRRRRAALHLLALLALISRLALPHLHAAHPGTAVPVTRGAMPAISAPATAGDAAADVIATACIAERAHHDASRCPVCQAIAHGAALPDAGGAIPRPDVAGCAWRLATAAPAVEALPSAPSRAPPLLS